MSLPEAIITVKVLKIVLPPGFLSLALRPFVLAKVGNPTAGYFQFGRSRLIPVSAAAETTFDFSGEPMVWEHQVPTGPLENVEVEAQIWDDRGDGGCTLIHTLHYADVANTPVAVSSPPTLYLDVRTQLTQSYIVALIARARISPTASATLTVRPEIFVELKEIQGLYEPGYTPATPPPHRRSEYHSGYLSLDHKGRIFINMDLNGQWAKNVQMIQVTAEVTTRGIPLPADAKLKWKVIDPDDPFNDRTDCHQEWGPYIDAEDYNSSGNQTGAQAGDNPRAFANTDFPVGTRAQLFDEDPRWEQVGAHNLTVNSDEEALTDIDAATRKSSVKIHCPNVGGTNLIVRAEVQTATPATIFPAQSGFMTMWKRLDVEVARMNGAHSLQSAVQSIAQFLEPACVQLDFQNERTLGSVDSAATMAPTRDTLSPRSSAWINRSSVFTKRTHPGWYFLGAAQLSVPVPSGAGSSPPLFNATSGWTISRTANDERIIVDGVLSSDASYAEFTWTQIIGGSSTSLSAGFIVYRTLLNTPVGKTTLLIQANDIQHKFTGHDSDGSLAHAYRVTYDFFPQGRFSGAWVGTGFGVPNTATLVVEPPGAVSTSGISPSVSASGNSYFAGRTIVFTHHGKFSKRDSAGNIVPRPDFDQRIVSTAVHEFVHAFGMPHKCGYWDYRTPRDKSCSMNYFNTWLIDPSTEELKKGSDGKEDNHLCGRHLMEVRRVHLEDNKGLNW